MRTTIDGAGRVVIPKRMRDRFALRGGDELEIEAMADRIEIRRAGGDEELVESADGLLTMSAGPGLDPDEVRDALEHERR